jgi:phosphatidate cytidylyltransferase
VKPLGIPWYLAIVLGILLGIAAVLGDLAESLIKRQTHVKDSGQIMPGHGGMLDRMDSLIFAVIVVYLFAKMIGQ